MNSSRKDYLSFLKSPNESKTLEFTGLNTEKTEENNDH